MSLFAAVSRNLTPSENISDPIWFETHSLPDNYTQNYTQLKIRNDEHVRQNLSSEAPPCCSPCCCCCCCCCFCWCIVTCVRGHPGTPRCNQDSRDYIMLPSKPPHNYHTMIIWRRHDPFDLYSCPFLISQGLLPFFDSTSPCVITCRPTIYKSEYNITDLSIIFVMNDWNFT